MLYHGGIAGKKPGDVLVPAPPHVEDGCPICQARAEGRACTVGEWRAWMKRMARGAPAHKKAMIKAALEQTADTPPWMPMDNPSERDAVYMTSDREYARWYAARSKGDLYRVTPIGRYEPTPEDPFPSWTAKSAKVLEVLERGVRLTRSDRRAIRRRWQKADKARAAAREVGVDHAKDH